MFRDKEALLENIKAICINSLNNMRAKNPCYLLICLVVGKAEKQKVKGLLFKLENVSFTLFQSI